MKMKLGVLFLGIPWPCILYQISVCAAENQVLGCGGSSRLIKSSSSQESMCSSTPRLVALLHVLTMLWLELLHLMASTSSAMSSPPTLPSATATKYQVLSAQLDFTTASHILPGLCWASARAGQMSPSPAPSWCCSRRQLFSLMLSPLKWMSRWA